MAALDHTWINEPNLDNGRLAALAHRHAHWCVDGSLAGRWSAEQLLVELRTATKHYHGPHSLRIVDTVAAVHAALVEPDVEPRWPDGTDSDRPSRAASVDAARSGTLSAINDLWASCGFDTDTWPEPDDIDAAPLPPLAELDTDTLVRSPVVIRQAGGLTLEGRLLAADSANYLLATYTDEQMPLSTVSLVPRGTVLSIGVYTEMLPWDHLDELDELTGNPTS